MRHVVAAVAILAIAATVPAPATAAVQVVFGESWDGPSATLQSIVDARYGPGRLNVTADYQSRFPTQPDPFFWIDDHFPAVLVREVAGFAAHNVLGWYEETLDGSMPVIDDLNDGVVFDGPGGPGSTTVVVFDRPLFRFGFYLDPNGYAGTIHAPQPERFYTNRLLNDQGPDGEGALHSPAGGDVQALIFDVSRFTSPNTWLVCFEDVDSGSNPGACCNTTDNDFNDMVFEITALSTTPNLPLTFGGLKRRYR